MKLALFACLAIFCLSTLALANSAPSNQGFPSKDGIFSAMLLIIPEAELKEFDKPTTERLKFHKLSKVKRNEAFAIKIGFSGLAQDAEQKSDITFDFKVMRPDGTMIGEEKNLPALQGKVPNPYYLFDTHAEIVMVFDDTDKSGKYKIIAEIRDNIGKKRIPLETEIELVD
jgi:hypothetical protein